MAVGLQVWSQTASSNATADSAINFAEGMAPSALNDSNRGVMSSMAKWRDDINGTITTGGAAAAYTVTTNQTQAALTAGYMVAFAPHATNEATVTLNVDSLGAKPLRSSPGVELPAGALVAGTPYAATYYTSNSGEWILHGFYGNPYSVPVGGMMPYLGSTAPNSSFVLPYGQAISRTTYATLFTLVSTTFGVGDGTTTFNVPDLRGRAIFGKDDMGGSAASRITSAVSSIDGATTGSVGGAESTTLARANLPNTSVTVTVTDPGHEHQFAGPSSNGDQSTGAGGNRAGTNGGTNFNTQSNTTGITAAFNLNGNVTQTAIVRMPPTIILPVILRVI